MISKRKKDSLFIQKKEIYQIYHDTVKITMQTSGF